MQYRDRLPQLDDGGLFLTDAVLGGCCGTDHRHVAAIRDAWLTFGK
jgi:methionine synthase I (cobalamin-dependent)